MTVPKTPSSSAAGTHNSTAECSNKRRAGSGDVVYLRILRAATVIIFVVILGLAVELVLASRLSLHTFGWKFLTSREWDPVKQHFGALSFILGTLYCSFWAMLIALPFSIGSAIYLSEIAPNWLRGPASFLIELLAAIPSVVYGLWAVLTMSPWLVAHIETPVSNHPVLGKLALFNAAPNGNDVFAASVVLAVMVTPLITAVSRDVLRAIPGSLRDGSYALGTTRWETIVKVVLPSARSGIIGAAILGLGRALGETMAVTMVIGNDPDFHIALFSPGYTMASLIANEYNEASIDLYRSSLIEIGLVLFVLTFIVNGAARMLVYYTGRAARRGTIAC